VDSRKLKKDIGAKVMNYKEAYEKDIQLEKDNPWYENLVLNKCHCGEQPVLDTSMRLIYCPNCGLSFEYRYHRGIVPYHTWQLYTSS
jgi:hypothetical protein